MKKKLKDYIAYYLGQPIELNEDRFADEQKDRVFTLSGVKDNRFCVAEHGEINLRDWYEMGEYHTGESHDKLVLRSLMDMTEPEALEFFGEVMGMNKQFDFHRYKEWKKENGFISVKDNRNFNGQWYVVIKPSGEPDVPCFNCTYSMREVTWLLKKGFDIFGLIAAGLAIDKNKL